MALLYVVNVYQVRLHNIVGVLAAVGNVAFVDVNVKISQIFWGIREEILK